MPESPYLSRPWLKSYDFWVPTDVPQPGASLYQVLQVAASQYTDRPATHFLGAELTFWQIKQRVDSLAGEPQPTPKNYAQPASPPQTLRRWSHPNARQSTRHDR